MQNPVPTTKYVKTHQIANFASPKCLDLKDFSLFDRIPIYAKIEVSRGEYGISPVSAKRRATVRTLLLDASYHPVRVINWQKAIILILSGRAEVVAEFDDVKIRSTRISFNLPKILRLFSPHRGNQQVQFNRYNVFYRDKFVCQYCVKKFNATELTFDHVVPQSRGGRTNWFNIVSCCHTCNRKKGNKTPEEVGMRLIKKPKQPKWTPFLCLRLKDDDPQEWFEFLQIRNVA